MKVQYFSWFEELSRLFTVVAKAQTDVQANTQNCLLCLSTSRKVSGENVTSWIWAKWLWHMKCQRKVVKYRHPISYRQTVQFSINRKEFLLFRRLKVNAESLLEWVGKSLTWWSRYKGNSLPVYFQSQISEIYVFSSTQPLYWGTLAEYTNEQRTDASKMSEVHLWHPNTIFLDAYIYSFPAMSLTIQIWHSSLIVSNSRRFFLEMYFFFLAW